MKKHKFGISFLRSHYNIKLFVSYILVLLIPLTLLTIFFFIFSSSRTYEQSRWTAENILTQTGSYLTDKILSYTDIITVISYDQEMQNALESNDTFNRDPYANWNVNLDTNTGNIMYTMNASQDISDIHIYSLDGTNTFENSSAYHALTPEEKNVWVEMSSNMENTSCLWLSPNTFSSSEQLGHTTLFKKIPNVSKLFSYVGIISATLKDDVFNDMLTQAAQTPQTSVVLYNSQYEIVSKNNRKDFTFEKHDLKKLNSIIQKHPAQSVQEIYYNNQSYLAGYSTITNSDWTLLMMIPKSDIMASNTIYIQQLVIVIFLLLLLFIPILYITSNSMSMGIQRLNTYITDAIQNHYKTIPLYPRSDEVGQLTYKFNEILTQINTLTEAQYRSGYELRNLELQVLQSQINPHFLYNALDMIYWLSRNDEDKRVSKIAKELGTFYKLSLAHGKSIVTIRDELEHIRSYVAIQNIRFDNKITLNINVPESMYVYPIIKLILQPLVENAILHGIRERENESGTITVSGYMTETNITLEVADDGVGMSKEKTELLLSPPSSNSGYAIWNIDERLKLTYGPSYGLSYTSSPNKGTSVKIIFPYMPPSDIAFDK